MAASHNCEISVSDLRDEAAQEWEKIIQQVDECRINEAAGSADDSLNGWEGTDYTVQLWKMKAGEW